MKNTNYTLIAVFACLGIPFMYAYYLYPSLPAIIPTHFNLKGEADGFGGRDTIYLGPAIMAVAGLFTYFLLANIKKIDPKRSEKIDDSLFKKMGFFTVLFLSVLSSALVEETLENGETRTVLNLPPALAPYKAAVFPLVKKDGLPELAESIMKNLKFDFMLAYDEKDTVGKRYRRQDAIGTPFCITVDHQSLEDNTVTIRDRATMKQERVSIDQLHAILTEKTSINSLLKM